MKLTIPIFLFACTTLAAADTLRLLVPQGRNKAMPGGKVPFRLEATYKKEGMLETVDMQLVDKKGVVLAHDVARAQQPRWEKGRVYNGQVSMPDFLQQGEYKLRVVGAEAYKCAKPPAGKQWCTETVTAEAPIQVAKSKQ
ncbi:uncharacterized protein VTP21DRAFT_11313 [Calcarisporiella thermophila]|uniref:uncharacterized protein n=1 Tax=Calcarisporiella thermophila TaxID=911321 RepID=UPI003744445D